MIAPETSLTVVKLAASIRFIPSASRQRIELNAKADERESRVKNNFHQKLFFVFIFKIVVLAKFPAVVSFDLEFFGEFFKFQISFGK